MINPHTEAIFDKPLEEANFRKSPHKRQIFKDFCWGNIYMCQAWMGKLSSYNFILRMQKHLQDAVLCTSCKNFLFVLLFCEWSNIYSTSWFVPCKNGNFQFVSCFISMNNYLFIWLFDLHPGARNLFPSFCPMNDPSFIWRCVLSSTTRCSNPCVLFIPTIEPYKSVYILSYSCLPVSSSMTTLSLILQSLKLLLEALAPFRQLISRASTLLSFVYPLSTTSLPDRNDTLDKLICF